MRPGTIADVSVTPAAGRWRGAGIRLSAVGLLGLLAWMGESVRRNDPRGALLEQKVRGFDAADRRMLLELVGELLAGVLPVAGANLLRRSGSRALTLPRGEPGQ